jgi:hypothetical protein
MVVVNRLLPTVIGPPEMSEAELCAARLDGEVWPIDAFFLPVDCPDDSVARASALRRLVGERVIAGLESALWVHGVLSAPPAVHTVCASRDDRTRIAAAGRVELRESFFELGDVAAIAGLRLTTCERTAYDLLFVDEFGHARERMLCELLRDAGCRQRVARRVDAAWRVPGKLRALERLGASA